MTPNWLAYCHCCMVAHVEWERDATWQCQRCTFRIPFVHLWWWCPVEERTNVQEAALAQERMF